MESIFSVYEYIQSMQQEHPSFAQAVKEKMSEQWMTDFISAKTQAFTTRYCSFMKPHCPQTLPDDLQNIVWMYALPMHAKPSSTTNKPDLIYSKVVTNFDHFQRLYPDLSIHSWKWRYSKHHRENGLTVWSETDEVKFCVSPQNTVGVSSWLFLKTNQ